MFDVNKKDQMLSNGFWPVKGKNGEESERMATALGNLLHRPYLFEEFSLKHGEILGEGPGVIIIFNANDQ